jgi:uncharacterized protein (DUF305 family)
LLPVTLADIERPTMRLTSGLIATIVFLATVGAHTASGQSSQLCPATPAATTTSNAEPANSDAVQDASDLTLIDAWVTNSALSITLANLGLEHASSPDVRRFALRVAESQAGELQLLRHWRDTWYPGAAVPDFEAQAQGVEPDPVSTLCATENDFDHTFAETMLQQLESSIELLRTVASQGQRAELTSFADSTIEARESDVAILVDILEDRFSPIPELDT